MRPLVLGAVLALNVGVTVVHSSALEQIRHKFHVLQLPADPLRSVPNLRYYAECEYTGFQYSHEWYFIETLSKNTDYTSSEWRAADYILVPQCISVIYFMMRDEFGLDHLTGMQRAENDYLVPLIEWAKSRPEHARMQGRNFILIYAMDLGRQDFPKANALTQNWSVGALTGHPDFLEFSNLYFAASPLTSNTTCYERDRAVVKQRDFKQHQDFVISFPIRFDLRARAREFHNRPNLVFFAGSLNSCARQTMHQLFAFNETHSAARASLASDPDVLVSGRVRRDAEYRMRMFTSQYCVVACGSSHTNNVRLYDVISHGCIPVVVSDDFQPPLTSFLDWRSFAVFLRSADVPLMVDILRNIDPQTRRTLHHNLAVSELSAMRVLHWHGGLFWNAMLLEIHNTLAHVQTARTLLASSPSRNSQNFRSFMSAWTGVATQALETTKFASSSFGCADAEAVLPSLAVLERQVRFRTGLPPVLVDAGANVGKTTGKMFDLFGDLAYRKFLAANGGKTGIESCVVCPSQTDVPNAIVFSIEPHPGNFRLLKQAGTHNGWELEKWIPVNAALSDVASRKMRFVMSCNRTVDEVAHLMMPGEDERIAKGQEEDVCVEQVQVNTLEQILTRTFAGNPYDVFFAKLDVEGHEARVLYSSRYMLLARRVKFWLFEYAHNTWKEPLQVMLHYMWSFGYMCFLVTQERLWAANGVFADKIYDAVIWGNYLCGHAADPDLQRLLTIHNWQPDDVVLSYLHSFANNFVH